MWGRGGGDERGAVALSSSGERGAQAAEELHAERTRQLQSMLDRARERGEDAPNAFDVLDHVLAPICLRVLFGMVPLAPDYVDGLVDRLLRPARPDPGAP